MFQIDLDGLYLLSKMVDEKVVSDVGIPIYVDVYVPTT